jgi:glycosyltransferase involved in cell wall biosynthesis
MNTPGDAKRVLFVITKANWGGAQRYVYDLALATKEHGYAVTVAHGTEGLLVEKLAEAGIRTLPLPSVERDVAMFSTSENALSVKSILESFKRELRALNELTRLFKEEHPDILHLNSSKVGVLGAIAGRLARVPRIIFTAHGWAFNEKRPWWQKSVFRVLYAITLWCSHRTIAVSNAIRREMRTLPFGKMTVVRHGMDMPDFFTKEVSREKFVPGLKDAFLIGMIAELHPTKRIVDAIDAIAELSPTHGEIMLVVMGEGEERAALTERIAQRKLETRVHLVGFVDQASRYLKAFDMFLMPSRTEALGLALVEAGYAGLPVVASRVGGIPEVVVHKESGLLVPPENPHALARAMRTLIEHPDQATEYAKKLEESVHQKFSKKRMIEETLAVYSLSA